jgi:Ca2+-binding EF-hand superfamily protein
MKTTQIVLFALAASLLVSAPLLADGHGEGRGHGKTKWSGQHEVRGKAMLEKLDSNNDGTVSIVEINQMGAKRAAEIDANNDGKITQTEIDTHRAQQREARQAARKAARFAKLDSNGDGIVTTAEFSSAQTARLVAMDTDKNGVISADEAKAKRGHHYGRHAKPAQ